jgi:hypothetical protein
MNNDSNDGRTSSLIQPQSIDRSEQKRQQEKERYAQMSNDKKNELLARKHIAYQQMKSLAGKNCTFNKAKNISIIACNNILMMPPRQYELLLLALSCHFTREN